MPVIIIDGPEKAGKTTVIEALIKFMQSKDIEAERVHWGKMDTDDRVYSPVLMKHTADSKKVWIWDRGWPSEYVYGKLLGRDRRMAFDPWIGEWLHGRAVQANGLRVILTGPSPEQLTSLRDKEDHPVSAELEQNLYKHYGEMFGWLILNNEHTAKSLEIVVEQIFNEFRSSNKWWNVYLPPAWSGPISAKTVFISSQASIGEFIPGGWLPFTKDYEIQAAREFGDNAFKAAWINFEDCNPRTLEDRETVVTFGDQVSKWYHKNIHKLERSKPRRLINLHSPELFYAYETERQAVRLSRYKEVVQSLKPI